MSTPYSTYSDASLLLLLSQADHKAFTEIYNRYWDRLLFIAGIKFRNLAIAEEMVQDIFLDLWNRRAEIRITGELEAYLAVSMKYKIINAQARLKRSLAYRHSAMEGARSDNSTEEWVHFHELQGRLSRLVHQLPEKCRITYQLRREEGLSQKEIARRLNISEKAVEANLTRALKSLRTALHFLMSGLFSILP